MILFISKVNNYMFRPIAAIFRLLQFCSKSVIYRHIYISYLLRYLVIYFDNKYHHLAWNYSCVFWLKLTHPFNTQRGWHTSEHVFNVAYVTSFPRLLSTIAPLSTPDDTISNPLFENYFFIPRLSPDLLHHKYNEQDMKRGVLPKRPSKKKALK